MSILHYSKSPMRRKFAAMWPMGDSRLTSLQTATGDDGRIHSRSNEDPKNMVSNAFDQNQHQLLLTGYNESNQYPAGSDQSKVAVTLDDLKSISHVPIKEDARAHHHGGGFYHPRDNFIGIHSDTSVPVAAHELGHAQFQESLLGKLTQHPLTGLAHMASAPAGVLVGSLSTGTTKQRLLKTLLTTLGLSGPRLLSEGVASYKGYDNLKKLKASDEELKQYTRTLAPSQATYLVNPGIGMLLGGLFAKYSAHKLDRRTTFRDFDISIETDQGNYRYWYDANAKKEGKTLMEYPYGYIRGTKGMDGDHVDCFVGPNENAKEVYVITTNKAPDFKQIDEQKCMLGFASMKEAKSVFMRHYTDVKFFNSIVAMPYEEFRDKAFATLHDKNKKVASFANFEGLHRDTPNTLGPFRDKTPGDYLGFPAGSLTGMRKIEGDSLQPIDKIDRQFRFNDLEMNTRVLENGADATPSSPGV